MGFGIKIKSRIVISTPKLPKIEVPKLPDVRLPDPFEILRKTVEEASKNLDKAINESAENISNQISTSVQQISNAATQLSQDLGQELTYIAEDIAQESQRAKENIDEQTTRLKQEIDREATRAKQNLDREAKKAKGKLDSKLTKLKSEIDKKATEAKQNLDREATRAKEDIDREASRLREDIDRELIKARKDVDEAIAASTIFVEENMQSLNETIVETGELLSEGKVLDALAHAATEPYKDVSGAYVAAISESKLLAQAASIAVTAYGGPTAGAAYSAWLTYEMTDNLNAAVQAGVVSAITAKGGEFVNGLPSETVSEQVIHEVTRASVNAAAVAASGGSKQDIEAAFMSSVTTAAQAKAQTALQVWVKTEVAPKFGFVDQPDMVDIGDKSLIDKAQTLAEDVDAFRAEYEHLVKAALDAEEFMRIQQD